MTFSDAEELDRVGLGDFPTRFRQTFETLHRSRILFHQPSNVLKITMLILKMLDLFSVNFVY